MASELQKPAYREYPFLLFLSPFSPQAGGNSKSHNNNYTFLHITVNKNRPITPIADAYQPRMTNRKSTFAAGGSSVVCVQRPPAALANKMLRLPQSKTDRQESAPRSCLSQVPRTLSLLTESKPLCACSSASIVQAIPGTKMLIINPEKI
jgi:hypothetical protein